MRTGTRPVRVGGTNLAPWLDRSPERGGGGCGTPIYGLYRYKLRDRVGFLRFSRVSYLPLLALCSQGDP